MSNYGSQEDMYDEGFKAGTDYGFEVGIEQGKAEGRREVVEWVELHKPYLAVNIHHEWQAQLKDWGLDSKG